MVAISLFSPLSTRGKNALPWPLTMMGERGVAVDHSTLNRWVIKYAPEFEKVFRRRQRPVGRSWRLDETYVKIKGKWAYLSRAVDKEGHTIDFLLTPTRDRDAAEA